MIMRPNNQDEWTDLRPAIGGDSPLANRLMAEAPLPRIDSSHGLRDGYSACAEAVHWRVANIAGGELGCAELQHLFVYCQAPGR